MVTGRASHARKAGARLVFNNKAVVGCLIAAGKRLAAVGYVAACLAAWRRYTWPY